jgi:hypothetical protein
MEKNTSQDQNNNDSNKQNKSNDEGLLTLLQPHDMSRTIESAMHVFQGRHEKLPDLLQDVGHILVKATKRFTTTQLIVATGVLTLGAVLVARHNSNDEEYNFQAE